MKNKHPINYHKHERRQGTLAWIIASVIVWIIVLASLSSCGSANKYIQGQRDSIYIEKTDTVIFRDTTILYQPADSSTYNTVPADSSSHLETDLAVSDAYMREGRLVHTLSNKTDLIHIRVSLPRAISHEKHYIIKRILETVEVEKPFKWYQEALMFVGKISIFLILLTLLMRFIKSRV